MLKPPAIALSAIGAVLRKEYGLRDAVLNFLPLGADDGAASYRATNAEGAYFVKLRLGPFDELAALAPHWLAAQGIREVMAPLPARSGQPFVRREGFTLLLYPFIDGRDGYGVALTNEQWIDFGRAMRAIHDAPLPAWLADRLPHEVYDGRWREQLGQFMVQSERSEYADPIARRLSAFLHERREVVLDLVGRTERLAQGLRMAPPGHVLCHTDLHAGNLLLAGDGRLFIVDWDTPLLAPRERDLMYPGGGQGFLGRTGDEEEVLFYSGYGQVEVNMRALAYYRLERIIEDLAIFCDQLLGHREDDEHGAGVDREQALRWAESNFLPGGVLEIACRTAARAAESGHWAASMGVNLWE